MSSSPEDRKEPKVEDLVVKLRKLQQAKKTLEEELWELQTLKGVLEQEEEALCSQAFQLDGILKEKEEAHRMLQFKSKELDQESQRQQEQNKQKEEFVEQYRYQIQEATLKHRKTRMKFENQLQHLMVQHKSLFSMFTPERLPAEIITAENATAQLLKAVKLRTEQLAQQQGELCDIHNGPVPTDIELLTTAV